MQNKTPIKRYFNEEKADTPPGKKPKLQKKGPKRLATTPNVEKRMFAGPKGSKQERKSDGVVKENGDTPTKKAKMGSFPGTAALGTKKGEEKSPETETSGEEAGNRAQRRRLRNKLKRKASRQNFTTIVGEMREGDTSAIEKIKKKMAAIESRDTLTNTARKKLRKLQGVLKSAGVTESGVGTKVTATKDNQGAKKQKKNQEKKQPKQIQKQLFGKKPEEDDSEEEEEDSDYDAEIAIKPDLISKKMNESSEEGDESEEEEEDDGDDSDDEDEDDDEDGDTTAKLPSADAEEESSDEAVLEEAGASDDEDESGDEEEEEKDDDNRDKAKGTPKKVFKNQQSPGNKQNESPQKGKSRYVVFVGNLPFEVTKPQIMEHFKKVGEIQDIRIATDPQTKKGRGFAYVELTNEESYQKALGLQNTFIGGRKINVQYTQGGKKKGENAKRDIKAKNMKLQAMRKGGKFAGARNPSQNRAQRRMKQGSK